MVADRTAIEAIKVIEAIKTILYSLQPYSHKTAKTTVFIVFCAHYNHRFCVKKVNFLLKIFIYFFSDVTLCLNQLCALTEGLCALTRCPHYPTLTHKGKVIKQHTIFPKNN